GGQAVLNMRLATTESYLDKDKVRRDRTDWHNVVVWGKRGEALSKILSKGSSIFVEGSLRTSSYDDKDGNKRYKTEVVANNVILSGGRGGSRAAQEDGGFEDRFDRGRGYGGGGGGGPRSGPDAYGRPAAQPDERGGGGGADEFAGGHGGGS